jgi:hypothetical protein
MAVFSFFLLFSLIIHKSFVKLGPSPSENSILSGSVPDPYHFGPDPDLRIRTADPDPDPAILVSDLQDAKKINFLAFFEGTSLHLHHSSKLKCHKKVKKNYRNQSFSYFFSR